MGPVAGRFTDCSRPQGTPDGAAVAENRHPGVSKTTSISAGLPMSGGTSGGGPPPQLPTCPEVQHDDQTLRTTSLRPNRTRSGGIGDTGAETAGTAEPGGAVGAVGGCVVDAICSTAGPPCEGCTADSSTWPHALPNSTRDTEILRHRMVVRRPTAASRPLTIDCLAAVSGPRRTTLARYHSGVAYRPVRSAGHTRSTALPGGVRSGGRLRLPLQPAHNGIRERRAVDRRALRQKNRRRRARGRYERSSSTTTRSSYPRS